MSRQRVLITGGTRGLGQAIGRRLARTGAEVVLTHRWGSVDEAALIAEWTAEGLVPPRILMADAAAPEDLVPLMATIAAELGGLDVVVSNVAFSTPELPGAAGLGSLKRDRFERVLGWSTWPLLDLVQASAMLPEPPRRYVAISSLGSTVCPPGYDTLGVAKAALEGLVRYLAARLGPSGVRVNAVRYGYLDTDGLRAMLPASELDRLRRAGAFLDVDAAAGVVEALCSGLLDTVSGQVIVADGGVSLLAPGFLAAEPADVSDISNCSPDLPAVSEPTS